MTNVASGVSSFSLKLNMLTDWHVGSGLERPGAEDRLVRRDADGLPFVPAKTLTAMIRDAAEQIALGQQSVDGDSHDTGTGRAADRWLQWVLFLFGDQPNRPGDILYHDRNHASRVSIRPAYLANGLRDALRSVPDTPLEDTKRREFREALVFTKPGVRIGRNGQSMNKHLRFDEMVRGGLTLTSSGCHLDCSGLNAEQAEFAGCFLNLAVRMVDRLGAKRRRGSGRVEIAPVTDTCDANALAEYFECLTSPPTLPERDQNTESQESNSLSATEEGNDWVQLPVSIELKTPLMALERTVGNVVKSLDFVPGTVLLSLVARTLRSIWPDVDRAIVAGELRVSPATIDMSSHESETVPVRGLPTPACVFHPKGSDRFAMGEVSNKFDEPEYARLNDHVKDFREGYVRPSGTNTLPAAGKPRKIVAPHSTVGEESQRPTAAVGGVFAYEAIAAGTHLCGEIRLLKTHSEAIAKQQPNWWERLTGSNSLGRSRKDDYGLIEMTPVGPPKPIVPSSGCSANTSGTDTITIWLTSDVLLGDNNLRTACTAKDLAQKVVRSLGLTMADVKPVSPEDAFLRHRRIESWHVGWGLPRASLVAIAAGSCLRIRRTGQSVFDAKQLATLEANGIGLRRSEGFGMLLINHPLVTQPISGWKPASEMKSDATIQKTSSRSALNRMAAKDVDPTAELLFRQLETTVWRQRIQSASIRIASTEKLREEFLGLKPGLPKPAQAALIRNLLQFGVETPQKKAAVLQRLDHVQELRGDRWPSGSLQKIHGLISGSTDIGKVLGSADWPRLTKGADLFSSDTAFRDRAVRTLIQAILKAHQSDVESARRQPTSSTDRRSGASTAAMTERSGHGS